jgi:hypothetical protein
MINLFMKQHRSLIKKFEKATQTQTPLVNLVKNKAQW